MKIQLSLGKCVLKELLEEKIINESQFKMALEELEIIYQTT